MANNEKKKNTLVKDTIAIFLITLVAGVLLGLVYQITKETIADREVEATNQAYAAVYDGAKFTEDEDLNKKVEAFNEELSAGKVECASGYNLSDVVLSSVMVADKGGYVLTASGKGYGGAVKVALGIDAKGNIVGIQITDCTNETPGLGQNSSKEEWNSQFKEATTEKLPVVNKDKEGAKGESKEVSAISGATITSRAVTRAVDGALLFVQSVSK